MKMQSDISAISWNGDGDVGFGNLNHHCTHPPFSLSQVDDWKTKNQILRSQLRQNGIAGAAGVDPQ